MQLPDYSNCGTNLTASILKFFGLNTAHQSLPAIDLMLSEGEYRNIVLLLFDGMSISTLQDHLPDDSFLKTHMIAQLSAVFPSTTTAATTSIITGLNPGEHGWIGWTLFFKGLNKSIDLFWNTEQFTREAAADYPVASTYFPYTTVTDLLTQSGKAKGVVISPFDGITIHSLDGLFLETKQQLREDGRHYIYAYWPEPDKQMHQFGCEHELIKQSLNRIEKGIIDLQSSLGPEDIILITADHGLIDSKPDFFEDYPILENMLLIPPAVEPRAAALYIKKEHLEAFPALFLKTFHDHYMLLSKEEALDSGLFGPGTHREGLNDLVGNYFAVAIKEYALYQKHKHYRLLGMHAGLTEREMYVPLIVIKGK